MPLSYIRDPKNGALIAPIERWMLDDGEATLCIPDARPGVLQLHLSMREIDPARDAVCDRWLAYHLAPRHRAWCELSTLAAKMPFGMVEPAEERGDHEAIVVEAAAISLPNTSLKEEGGLIRQANVDRSRLKLACEQAGHREYADARCVGVDQWGIDVRTTFGPSRLDVQARRVPQFVVGDRGSVVPTSGPELVGAIVTCTLA